MQYQVPRNVETRFTFFPDFGMKELLICSIGAIIGFFAQFFVGLFISKVIVKILVFLIFPVFCFFLTKPFTNNQSLLTLLKKWHQWKKSQKRYFFYRKGF